MVRWNLVVARGYGFFVDIEADGVAERELHSFMQIAAKENVGTMSPVVKHGRGIC